MVQFLSDAKLARNPPTSVDAANKAYVDQEVATRITQAAADTLYVNVAGDTMTGKLTVQNDVQANYMLSLYGADMGGYTISSVGTPASNTDAVTKVYCDDQARVPGPQGPPGLGGESNGEKYVGVLAYDTAPVVDPLDPWPVGQLWIDTGVQAVRTQVISYAWNATGADMATATVWTAPSSWAKVLFTAPSPGVLVLNALATMYCKTASGEYIMRLNIGDMSAGVTVPSGSPWGRINNYTLISQHPTTVIGMTVAFTAAGQQCSIIPQGYTAAAATWAFRDVFLNGVFHPHAGYIALTGAT